MSRGRQIALSKGWVNKSAISRCLNKSQGYLEQPPGVQTERGQVVVFGNSSSANRPK